MASNKLRTRITYTSEVVDQMSSADVRKAYSKLRHIATERYEKLKRYGYTDRQAYIRATIQNAEFPTMKGLPDGVIRQLLLDTSRWLRDPMSKVGEVRRRDISLVKTFHEMGYKFINRDNINQVLQIMNDLVEANQDKVKGSPKYLEAIEQSFRLNISPEYLKANIDKFIENREKIRKLEPTGNPQADSVNLSRALGIKTGYVNKSGPTARAAEKAKKRAGRKK